MKRALVGLTALTGALLGHAVTYLMRMPTPGACGEILEPPCPEGWEGAAEGAFLMMALGIMGLMLVVFVPLLTMSRPPLPLRRSGAVALAGVVLGVCTGWLAYEFGWMGYP